MRPTGAVRIRPRGSARPGRSAPSLPPRRAARSLSPGRLLVPTPAQTEPRPGTFARHPGETLIRRPRKSAWKAARAWSGDSAKADPQLLCSLQHPPGGGHRDQAAGSACKAVPGCPPARAQVPHRDRPPLPRCASWLRTVPGCRVRTRSREDGLGPRLGRGHFVADELEGPLHRIERDLGHQDPLTHGPKDARFEFTAADLQRVPAHLGENSDG